MILSLLITLQGDDSMAISRDALHQLASQAGVVLKFQGRTVYLYSEDGKRLSKGYTDYGAAYVNLWNRLDTQRKRIK